MNPKEQAKNLMLLHFDRIHREHTIYSFERAIFDHAPQYFDCKVGATIVIESHLFSENNSPFPTMDSWRKNDNYWNEVKQELDKI